MHTHPLSCGCSAAGIAAGISIGPTQRTDIAGDGVACVVCILCGIVEGRREISFGMLLTVARWRVVRMECDMPVHARSNYNILL